MKVLETLKENNILLKKKYGQNFITDPNFLKSIVEVANIAGDDVLEIGTGAATLTKQICKKAKEVISYEIDKTLENVIKQNLSEETNVKVVFDDALKTPLEKIEADFDNNYSIVANIPYYITSPLIFKFLEGSKRLKSMTLMIQKEVAERIIAKHNTSSYGVLGIMIDFYGDAKILKIVSKKMFKPVPKVDSAIIQIVISRKYDIDCGFFSKFVKAAFSNRRKTLSNNISSSFNIAKADFENILNEHTLSTSIRAEAIEPKVLVSLAKSLKNRL